MYLAQRIAPLIRAGIPFPSILFRISSCELTWFAGYTNINGPTFHTENLVSAVGLGCVSLISFDRLRLLIPFYLVGLPATDISASMTSRTNGLSPRIHLDASSDRSCNNQNKYVLSENVYHLCISLALPQINR
jgi:hypothetical protein